jgi:hypothetical protein
MATAPKPSHACLSRLILAGLCAVAAGCGGEDTDSDTEQITTAVKRVMESEDVRDQCETGVSERFVREVYVTLAQCREVNKTDPGEEDDAPDAARISHTRIEGGGGRATTAVILTSVKGARASGRVTLVKVGGAWKVDRLGVDFLRSVFATLPAQADTAEERRILRCLAAESSALSDAAVRRIGNLIVGQRLTAQSLPAGVVRCIQSVQQDRQTTT